MTPLVRKRLALSAVGVAVLAAIVVFSRDRRTANEPNAAPARPPSARPPDSSVGPPAFDRSALREKFVGSRVCAPCHEREFRAHETSHHAKALALVGARELDARLRGASFSTTLGGATRFSAHGGVAEAKSPDGDGRERAFSIIYVAGVSPLEQYVVATENGKLQSLGVAWDARPKSDGGERWFHVYGQRGIAHEDELFFTRAAQNWNHVCADCHSTFVERRYDLASDRFDTRWAELSVGCEACHGPGAEHVRAAKAGDKSGWAGARAFAVTFEPAVPWVPSASGSPTPRRPDTVEHEVCAPCHSRRQPLREGFIAGDPLLAAFEPELLRFGPYRADGQVEGEVYEWGSFLQSKMHASGVRCSDCHEPHSASLRATGNTLCGRCHTPARFDAEAHSHHDGPKAPLCIDCHMPAHTFMQIDERRDHSIRIPRPDLSALFGTPNACTDCHQKKDARWALDAFSKWYPDAAKRPHFAEALAKDARGALDAPRALRALALDARAPAIARATALERLGRFPTPRTLETLRSALSDAEPLAVYGAVLGARSAPLAERVKLLLPMVDHRLLAIRIAAGKALAVTPLADLDPARRAALERAFSDVESSFAVNASRPQTHVERSAFLLARGKVDDAERALQTALRLAPCIAEAHLNLADLARSRNDEPAAEREIRAALACNPKHGSAHHALGLSLVRQKKAHDALASLVQAVELEPNEPRFGYVLAVARADAGDVVAAIRVIDAALAKRPNDPELLNLLASYEQRLGHEERAADARQKLREVLAE
jgi:predicted CXXCH cytochrome family protein